MIFLSKAENIISDFSATEKGKMHVSLCYFSTFPGTGIIAAADTKICGNKSCSKEKTIFLVYITQLPTVNQ